MNSFPNKLQRWQIVGAVLIVLLAFGLRAGVVYQRAANDPSFMPTVGEDQQAHIEQAAQLLAGSFPDAPFHFQPAPPYTYAIMTLIYGSPSVPMFALTVALINALTCGWLIGSGWLLTRRVWGGYIAGLWYAIAAPSVFYGATLTIAPQAIMWLALTVFLVIWQKERFALWRTVWIGIALGIATLLRINLMPIIFIIGLWFVLQKNANLRQKLVHVALLFIAFGGVIGQVTWHNYRTSGDFILLVDIGSKELYWANNRQSQGRNTQNPAVQNLDATYEEALMRDIRLEPLRFAGLIGYKFAIFWSPNEIGNNSYYALTRDSSSLLRLMPFNFSILAFGGLLGLWLLLWKDWRDALFFTLVLTWMGGTFLAVFVYGRLRHPVEALFIPPFAYAIVTVVDLLRSRNRSQLGLKFAPPVALGLLLIGFTVWTLQEPPNLPAKRTVHALPADANVLNARFGDVLLLGWRPVDDWEASEQGWVQVFDSYGVELFWTLAEPTDTTYNFYMAYIENGERINGIDTPLGGLSFPEYTTDNWQMGTIYADILNLRLDEFEATLQQSGQIQVGVWYWDEDGLIQNVPMSEPAEAPQLTLQNIAVFNILKEPDVPDVPAVDVTFGDKIILRGIDAPETSQLGQIVEIGLIWETLENITTDYTLLVHIEDETGTMVGQGDTQPIAGLLTSNWALNYPLYGTISVTLPDVSGDYTIYIGFYNSGERLSTVSSDGRYAIATLSVR